MDQLAFPDIISKYPRWNATRFDRNPPPDRLVIVTKLDMVRLSENGLFFALGHGLIVTVLAIGAGQTVAGRFAFMAPWILIQIGIANLWKVSL